MVKLIVDTAGGEKETITARQYGEAFDRAEELGAVLAVDGLGERFICLCGEWIGLPGGRRPASICPSRSGDDL